MGEVKQEPPIEEQLQKMLKDLKEISGKTGLKLWELIPVLTLRELVILNKQLTVIHEMTDYILDAVKKPKA